jgi:uncharacterized membrane protein
MESASSDLTAARDATSSRVVVATFDNYRDAERAVDKLSDEGFPVDRAAIVGSGLKLVEQIAGRTTTARSALSGALSGATIGAVFALFLGLFFTLAEGFLGLLVYGIVVGAFFGAILGAVGQAVYGGRRDFTSVSGMQAEAYEVQVDAEVADRARELLKTGAAL